MFVRDECPYCKKRGEVLSNQRFPTIRCCLDCMHKAQRVLLAIANTSDAQEITLLQHVSEQYADNWAVILTGPVTANTYQIKR